jgi:hypothetical protein
MMEATLFWKDLARDERKHTWRFHLMDDKIIVGTILDASYFSSGEPFTILVERSDAEALPPVEIPFRAVLYVEQHTS